MTKDYYKILGVLDDAEDIVIKAAYKALAQRYHPDKWAGSKEGANKRMAEINEAFSVLSDPEKRKQYDSTRERDTFEEGDQEAEDELLSSVERDWSKVTEYYPDLKATALRLARLSKSLEYTYKVTLLSKKNFNEQEKFSELLEQHFLEKYFGVNKKIIAFAKKLILGKQKDAAKELNEVARLIGSGIEADSVIKKIVEKFALKDFIKTIYLATCISNGTIYDERLAFLKLLGFEIKSHLIGFTITYKGISKRISGYNLSILSDTLASNFLETYSYIDVDSTFAGLK
jgi:hypothetical protein